MKDDPRIKHQGYEPTVPPPAPDAAKLRPPCGTAVARHELPPRVQLPPLPEKHPVTVSQVEELLDAALEDFEERTGVTQADPNAPKAVKVANAANAVIRAFPKDDRISVAWIGGLVVLAIIVCATVLIGYSVSLGHVPGWLK